MNEELCSFWLQLVGTWVAGENVLLWHLTPGISLGSIVTNIPPLGEDRAGLASF